MWTILYRLTGTNLFMQPVFGRRRRSPRPSRRPPGPLDGVITITGIGDHFRLEWPITFTGMRRSLWQTVETVNTDPADNQLRGQMLSLLAAAHQSRETRLYQMTQGVPGLIWSLLIIFACTLIGCTLVFAAEASTSKAVLVGVFTSSLTLALRTVRGLDFPFESALQLTPRDFNGTLEKVDRLIAAAQPQPGGHQQATVSAAIASASPLGRAEPDLPYLRSPRTHAVKRGLSRRR